MQKKASQHVVAIIQARMGSTRLPGKILKEVMGKPLLSYLLERLRRVQNIDEIVIATTLSPKDQEIVDFCQKENISYYRGSEEDVLDRYYQAAKAFSADVVVRITSDCPLIDPRIVDQAIQLLLDHYPNYDYVSNTQKRTFPRGLDVEVFSFKSLEKAAYEAKSIPEREHVTPFIIQHSRKGEIINTKDISFHRWTVDTPEDFALISTILQNLYPKNPTFITKDVLEKFREHPEWIKINEHVVQKNV